MRSTVQWIGLFAAPVLALLAFALLPESYADTEGGTVVFSRAGRATAGLAVLMGVAWMTEAIPVYATALFPIAVLPLVGAASITQATSPYAHPLIFLFMGGFLLALAMQRWGLDRRIALRTLHRVGAGPRRVVGGFMAVTAALSMAVSNTATTVMMLPIALSVIELERAEGADESFATCLLLGIAYAASIGGVGTLIGTPPNLFLASYVQSHLGQEISFVRWLGIGLPLVAVFGVISWALLTHVLFPLGRTQLEGGGEPIRRALAGLGKADRGEWICLCVFALTAGAWITRPLLVEIEIAGARPLAGLSDAGIAIVAALALFVLPVDVKRRVFVMDWETAVKLPWGLLVLFGGGLSLAAALDAGGVGAFLGTQVSALRGVPTLLIVALVVALVIFLTELTSNTATAATFIPILAGIAPGLGLSPFVLIVPAAIAASCAFMLPVATPPNAVVFGSGLVSIPQMCRAGLSLNLIGIALITALTYAVAMPLLGVPLGG
jgi:sodium-dependent dicarboxylate transporter 2/3/5